MKTSINWLKQYVDLPWTPQELAQRLTMAGLEVEGIELRGAIPAGVVVAQIVSRAPHPNSDHMSVCQVTTGSGEPVQVVCGAPNCEAGRKAVLATLGTTLGDFKIKKAKLRGVESLGMLCSRRELGLDEDHSGIILLPDDAPLGQPFGDYLGSDAVIDWEVTPNRPDWLSHIGIAREIAAVADVGASFRVPELKLNPVPDTDVASVAAVEVTAPDLCLRYLARVIRNVKVGPSPAWMCQALESVGLRPINNVVDITNYVMLECGQPLHAFDLERLAGHRIVVRRAGAGEKIVTLDGKQHELTPDNLLIADADKGVALAGIMGGENSMIADTTTTVLLESAVFLPRNVRATAKRLAMATDSSHRFERGVSLETCAYASARAAQLLCELAGGELLAGTLDVYAQPFRAPHIVCRVAQVNRVLGLQLTPEQIMGCFARLGLRIVNRTDAALELEIPHYRLDLLAEVDLIEEVARIYGLEKVPETPAAARVGGLMVDDRYYAQEEARAQLLGLGLDEVLNYSFLAKEPALAGTGVTEAELFLLANPISTEGVCLRPSLLPGLLQNVAHNLHHDNPDLALFEIGRVLVRNPQWPEERWQAGIVLTGRAHPERFGAERGALHDFFDLKGRLEAWFAARRLPRAVCEPAEHPAFVAGQTARFVCGDKLLAVFGEVVPALTHGMRLKAPLYVALVELETLYALGAKPRKYEALPQFPATVRDISLVAPEALACDAVLAAIRAAKCPWLEKAELFDLFTDAKALGPGKKSMAFSLTYRRLDRTLTDEEVNAAHEKLKADLAAALPVQYR